MRNNIIFGQPFIEARYSEVLNVCALRKDLKQLPHGDQTLVGDKGVSLSGGQKARVNLARAVYRQADIYILDDPLSSVDAHIGNFIFEECISTYLSGKTRVLVTHQLQYLKDTQHVVVLKEVRFWFQFTGIFNTEYRFKGHNSTCFDINW